MSVDEGLPDAVINRTGAIAGISLGVIVAIAALMILIALIVLGVCL
jgi:hypothetical protein